MLWANLLTHLSRKYFSYNDTVLIPLNTNVPHNSIRENFSVKGIILYVFFCFVLGFLKEQLHHRINSVLIAISPSRVSVLENGS